MLLMTPFKLYLKSMQIVGFTKVMPSAIFLDNAILYSERENNPI